MSQGLKRALPQFRGPDGQGHSDAKNLPLTWSETENVTWKVPIAGLGWSSPSIQDNQIWLTTAIEDGKSLHVISLDRRQMHPAQRQALPRHLRRNRLPRRQ